jgi:cell division protein DivIC
MAKRKKLKLKNIKGIVCMLLAFIMIYTLVASLMRIHDRQLELANLTSQRDALNEEKEALNEEVSLLNDDDYVVRWAREHYIFSKDGEKVATLPESKK